MGISGVARGLRLAGLSACVLLPLASQGCFLWDYGSALPVDQVPDEAGMPGDDLDAHVALDDAGDAASDARVIEALDAAADASDASVDASSLDAGDTGPWWTDVPPTQECYESGCTVGCVEDRVDCSLDCKQKASCTGECNMHSRCYTQCSGTQECNLKCSERSNCELDCSDNKDGTCKSRCEFDSTCHVDCTNTTTCKNECVSGSRCTIDCRGEAQCNDVQVDDDSSALVYCSLSKPCRVVCSALISCPGNLQACNRDCP